MPFEVVTDRELERALLASLLADNSGFDRLCGLEPDDFSDPIWAGLLSAMLDLREDGRAVNFITLRSRCVSVPFNDETSALEHLKQVGADAASVEDIATTLLDQSRRRQVHALGEEISGAVYDLSVGAGVFLSDAARAIDELQAKCRPAGRTTYQMDAAADDLLAAETEKNDCITTGLESVDRVLGGGFRPAQSIVLAGRPSMGKSALACSLARRSAMAGHSVLIFSLEMSVRECMARLAADACWRRDRTIAYSDARARKLQGRDLEAFRAGVESLRKLPITIDGEAGLSASEIAARTRREAERLKREGRELRLVIIDHLGKAQASDRYKGSKVNEIGELSDAMARLAKRENVAVLALHQINRGVEGRDNKRPALSDLRDSGTIEQDADVVMFVFRSIYYLERMKCDDDEEERERITKLERKRYDMEIMIAKNRGGATGNVEVYANMAANAVRDRWKAR